MFKCKCKDLKKLYIMRRIIKLIITLMCTICNALWLLAWINSLNKYFFHAIWAETGLSKYVINLENELWGRYRARLGFSLQSGILLGSYAWKPGHTPEFCWIHSSQMEWMHVLISWIPFVLQGYVHTLSKRDWLSHRARENDQNPGEGPGKMPGRAFSLQSPIVLYSVSTAFIPFFVHVFVL